MHDAPAPRGIVLTERAAANPGCTGALDPGAIDADRRRVGHPGDQNAERLPLRPAGAHAEAAGIPGCRHASTGGDTGESAGNPHADSLRLVVPVLQDV